MSDGPEMAFLGGGRGLAYFTLKRLGHIGILELPMEGKRESYMFRLGQRTRIFHIERIGLTILSFWEDWRSEIRFNKGGHLHCGYFRETS